MTLNEIFIPVRQKLNDMQKLHFSDQELIQYFNRSLSDLCIILSNAKDPEVMSKFTITDAISVNRPIDFINFVGAYPVEIYTEAGVVKCKALDDTFIGTMDIKYFASKSKVTSLSDTVPFIRQQDISALIDSVFGYASTRDGKAVAQ